MTPLPTIALSARWHAFPDRLRWIAAHGFALDYAPNPEAFPTLSEHIDPFLKAGIPVRYHGFFRGYEFGHRDPACAEAAMRIHRSALDAIQDRAG